MTSEERKEARRISLYKYNHSEKRKMCSKKYNASDKRKAVNARYYETHKEEQAILSKEWRLKNKDRVEEAKRLWRQTESGKLSIKRTEKKYCSDNREKRFAKDAVNNSLKAGKLEKGICWCGCRKVEGHHPDYSKPLEVIWLCKKHHLEKHYGFTRHPSGH